MTVLDDRPTAARPVEVIDTLRLNAAQRRLAAAVGELLQPSLVVVDRADVDEDQADEDEHRARIAALRKRHAAYAKRRDHAGMRRTLAVIVEWESAHRAAAAARAARLAELPSLLDQLVDAVTSTQGGGGAAAGVHRWHYGVDAAELLAEIDRTVRPTPARQAPYRKLTPAPAAGLPTPPPRELPRLIRSWAGLAGHWRTTRPQRLLDAADTAEAWVARTREVLAPPRRKTLVGACPHCGNATAYVPDSTGEVVRRDALELDVATGVARCLVPRCEARWPPERLQWLGLLLTEQATAAAAAADESGTLPP